MDGQTDRQICSHEERRVTGTDRRTDRYAVCFAQMTNRREQSGYLAETQRVIGRDRQRVVGRDRQRGVGRDRQRVVGRDRHRVIGRDRGWLAETEGGWQNPT